MADPTAPPPSNPAPSNPAPTITEFPIPGADPTAPGNSDQALDGITLGPDGNIWAVMRDEPTIVRILSHAPYTVTEFPIPTDDSYPFDITTGPDGNLWFTEQGDFKNEGAKQAGKIGRILSHAPYTITEFNTADPQNRPRPEKIVTGPDRNLYFTEHCEIGPPTVASCPPNAGGSVGRITPFGSDARIQASVTQVAHAAPCTPAPCNSLHDITVGPDRNLWVTDYTTVDRLTLPGYQLTAFPVPDGVNSYEITTGIDGNLWFTGYGPNFDRIGRISPRDPSNITLYPASPTNPNPDALGITTGPDGKVWFGEGFNNGRIATFSPFTPDKIIEYNTPDPNGFYGRLVSGPCDNSIWFTDYYGFIGRIQLPGPPGLTGLFGSGGLSGLGSGVASYVQSLLGRLGPCLASRLGTFDGGQ